MGKMRISPFVKVSDCGGMVVGELVVCGKVCMYVCGSNKYFLIFVASVPQPNSLSAMMTATRGKFSGERGARRAAQRIFTHTTYLSFFSVGILIHSLPLSQASLVQFV